MGDSVRRLQALSASGSQSHNWGNASSRARARVADARADVRRFRRRHSGPVWQALMRAVCVADRRVGDRATPRSRRSSRQMSTRRRASPTSRVPRWPAAARHARAPNAESPDPASSFVRPKARPAGAVSICGQIPLVPVKAVGLGRLLASRPPACVSHPPQPTPPNQGSSAPLRSRLPRGAIMTVKRARITGALTCTTHVLGK
jgi:hypothetical protein